MKPIRLADFTGFAMLQGACGSRLSGTPSALQLRQTRQSLNLGFQRKLRWITHPLRWISRNLPHLFDVFREKFRLHLDMTRV